MTFPLFWPDFTNIVTVATTTTDATITVPNTNGATALSTTPNDGGSFWYLSVVGAPVYINYNSPATSANACVPVGMTVDPIRIPPNTVMHFVTTIGSGTVSIIRGRMAV